MKFFDEFVSTARLATFSAEVLHIAASGTTVLTERVDRAVLPNRKIVTAGLRVISAFEVHEGKITAWRDYVDSTPLKRHCKC